MAIFISLIYFPCTGHRASLALAIFGAASEPQILPPELLHQIFGHLDTKNITDRDALTKCAFVCKAWLPWVSVRLLATIKIRGSQELERYLALAAHSQRLATYVRELFIWSSFDVTPYLEGVFTSMPNIILLSIGSNWIKETEFSIPPVSDRPHDHTLRFPSFRNSRTPPGSIAPISGALSVRHLRLAHIQWMSLPQFLRPFGYIGTLELQCIDGYSGNESQTIAADEYLYEASKRSCTSQTGSLLPMQSLRKIENVVVEECWSCELGAMLAKIPIRPTTLTLSNVGVKDLFSLLRYMGDAGENVECLTLILRGVHSTVLSEGDLIGKTSQ